MRASVSRPDKDKIDSVFASAAEDCSAVPTQFENARHYNNMIAHGHRAIVHRVHPLGSKMRILELGAFTGVVAVTLQRLGHQVTASDVPFVMDDPALAEFLDKEGIKRCGMDLSNIHFPLPDSSFDLINFHSVLSMLNFNPLPLYREFHRLLVDGGLVVCGTTNLHSAKNLSLMLRRKGYLSPVEHLSWALMPGKGMSVGLRWREWGKDELIETFEASGFRLVSHTYDMLTANRSKFPRKQLVAAMYRLFPSLMVDQTAIFAKV